MREAVKARTLRRGAKQVFVLTLVHAPLVHLAHCVIPVRDRPELGVVQQILRFFAIERHFRIWGRNWSQNTHFWKDCWSTNVAQFVSQRCNTPSPLLLNCVLIKLKWLLIHTETLNIPDQQFEKLPLIRRIGEYLIIYTNLQISHSYLSREKYSMWLIQSLRIWIPQYSPSTDGLGSVSFFLLLLCGLEVLELKGEDLWEDVGVWSPEMLLIASRDLISILEDLVTALGEGLDKEAGTGRGVVGLPTDIAPILVITSRLGVLGTETNFAVNQREVESLENTIPNVEQPRICLHKDYRENIPNW